MLALRVSAQTWHTYMTKPNISKERKFPPLIEWHSNLPVTNEDIEPSYRTGIEQWEKKRPMYNLHILWLRNGWALTGVQGSWMMLYSIIHGPAPGKSASSGLSQSKSSSADTVH